ncbi:AAA ATPase [Methylobacterium sp. 4-46]|uniref:ATP-binding protein n=1 Tax=Methylobacterium sp. (strain 4-46) TaxID=426117 RepID=UPI000165CD1A|nr:ATP-binding protein [Methylobacterium sp. 4-46]ACA19440.1 AAA ATPase [Methylobacterium sp. 4-46]
MTDALDALRRVDFDWVNTLDSVWIDAGAAPGPNSAQAAGIVREFVRRARAPEDKLKGAILVGQSGIGKTHLVGEMRREIWRAGGWFVLLDVLGLADFWRSTALSYLTALLHRMPDGRRQCEAVLAGVARRFNVEQQVEQAFATPDIDARRVVDLLVRALTQIDMARALRHQDVFRALCLLRASDVGVVGLAHAWLQGHDADEEARRALGFRSAPPPPAELVAGMSWVMSLAGPTLVAVDQIDGVVSPASAALGEDFEPGPNLAAVLTAGLLELHDVRHRGQTVVTCLVDSWERIRENGLRSGTERFEPPVALLGMNDRRAASALVVDRLGRAYAEAGFTPPFPTWPFGEVAIAEAAASGMMPRTLLMRCDAHRRACLERGTVTVCESLIAEAPPRDPGAPRAPFDLAAAARAADIAGLLDGEDDAIGPLLRDAFDLYALQAPPHERVEIVNRGDPDQRIPPLHGRLTFIFRDDNDRERHICYRGLTQRHAIAFQARLRAALTASGIRTRLHHRELVLVRRGPPPGGAKTQQLFDVFTRAGGRLIDPADADLRLLVALQTLRARAVAEGRLAEFEAWMRAARPLDGLGFFRAAGLGEAAALAPPPAEGATRIPPRRHAAGRPAPDAPPFDPGPTSRISAEGIAPEAKVAPEPRRETPPGPRAEAIPDRIPLGRRTTPEAEPVDLATALLRRHTAIIAGSGSGKTVLLRRIVEEAALAGLPAIVVDPNNDLSRLGDPWPEPPVGFTAQDEARAGRYRAQVEVVVWTPGLRAGNPLFVPAMPDFSGLGGDADERDQAVEMAVETLAPLAVAGGRRELQRGVLADALRFFAGRGGGDLPDFTALLSDLPDGISLIGDAGRLAAGMANQLHAAVATNPLLRAEGPVIDPALLFFGRDPARTRISVVNLSGLASEAAREDFVNRLQMTLFGWIKRHPSPRGLLYVMDEAQTFLPAQRQPPSLGSGIKLAAQGRKYGLGMILATQAPRGIHNQIVSNCTTQFLGRQASPATIAAAHDILSAKGGGAGDIGKLKAGEFYFSTEGSGRPAKLRTPYCLSHHPANPPTPEEVTVRAHRAAQVLAGG